MNGTQVSEKELRDLIARLRVTVQSCEYLRDQGEPDTIYWQGKLSAYQDVIGQIEFMLSEHEWVDENLRK